MKRVLIVLAALGLGTSPAFAHLDPIEHGAFLAGFTHPVFGLDHVLAMVAVGLWAASLGVARQGSGQGERQSAGRDTGRIALWAVPAAFVATMAIGFGAAIAGMPLPFVEPVILASVIFVGIMVALALPLPVAGVASVVGFFALFHGHAHGGEIGVAGAFGYASGFLVATAALHGAGVGLGLAIERMFMGRGARAALRVLGGAAGIGGLWLAIGG